AMTKLFVNTLLRPGDAKLFLDLPEEEDRRSNCRQKHGRMAFVRLGLNTNVHFAAGFFLMFTETSDTLFEVLVHLADRRGGQVIAEGTVPDYQGRRDLRMPGLAQGSVGQIHGLCPQFVSFCPLVRVERSQPAVGKMA